MKIISRPKIYVLHQLSSSRAYIARRTKAVESLEQLLAEICASDKTTKLEFFLKLQDGFECNGVCISTVHCIELVTNLLELVINSTGTTGDNFILVENPGPDAASLSQLIIQLLCVLQGVSLLHPPSKLFIDLQAISKHLYPSPLSSTAKTPSKPPSPNANPTLASSTIDVLLCVLVDAPSPTRTFEEIGGVEVVVKTLKRTGVPQDIRIKCLEFLYFYLLDETGDIPAMNLKTGTPIIRSSSEEGFSPQKSSSAISRSPSSPEVPRTPRKPRNLGLLRKEPLDFVPITPKKAQVARLGVGTPRKSLGRTPLGKLGTGEVPPLPASPIKRVYENVIPPLPASPTKRTYGNVTPPTLASPMKCSQNSNTPFAAQGQGGSPEHGERRRTTQEKKEILSGLLGNVDTLVESVSKSGIWGLG
ncbi:hypothetical protein M422DRAFT_33770 [Sphaerobolus stellatus SS14]|uniref:Cell division control protein 14 n=1 Tax=Sphaerobolus stellatus (strain SS14) TaxID=990650 RepID=A0A0C9V7D9_SPHS4|nr:hypothetical protein M422DRAFT_33770 [Sphaerobolus stellatus SS14]